MPHGAPPGFFLDGANGIEHRFNQYVVGRGRVYPRVIPEDERCIIKIVVGVSDAQLAGLGFLREVARVACHVNSDARRTVFQGQVAADLNLQPVSPFFAPIATHSGVHPGWWSSHELWVAFGPGYMPLDVWFPVEQIEKNTWQWRLDRLPEWNVLGMRGVVDKRMICVTSTEVYAFERL